MKDKKRLKDEVQRLLNGPQPDRTLFYFDGKYHLLEDGKLRDIDRDQAISVLEDPKIPVYFIHVDFQEPPPEITDKTEHYMWRREHPVEPVIPDELKGRITQQIGVADYETGLSYMDLVVMAKQGK